MEPTSATPMEDELLKIKVQYSPGLMAQTGMAVLTTQTLSFRPSAIDRFAGAEEWQIAIAEIEQLKHAPLTRTLVVEARSGKYRLRGKNTALLHERLAGLMNSLGKHVTAELAIPPHETVLLHGHTDLHARGVFAISGVVTLANERIGFSPDPIDRLVFGPKNIEVPISSITGVRHAPIRRRVTLDTTSGPLRFGGSLTPALHVLLKALIEEKEHGGNGSDLLVVEAALHREPLHHPGLLVVNTRTVRFSSSSRVDSLLGQAPELEIPLSTVSRLSVQKGIDLSIHDTTGVNTLRVEHPRRLARRLLPRLARVPMADEPSCDELGRLSEEDAAALLDRWSAAIPEEYRVRPRLVGPVVWEDGSGNAERGWVLYAQGFVIPLLSREPGAPAPVMKEEELLEARPSDVLAGVLDLQVPGIEAHGVARGGTRFVETFWSLLPERPLSPPPSHVPRKKKRKKRRYERERRESYRARLLEPLPVDISLLPPDEAAPAASPGPPEPSPPPETDDAAPPELTRCLLRDLSVGGAGIYTERRVSLKTRIQVRLSPDAEPIDAKAEVLFVHTGDRPDMWWRLGVQFIEVDPDTERKIEALWTAIQRTLIHYRRQQAEEEEEVEDIGEIELEPMTPPAGPPETPTEPTEPAPAPIPSKPPDSPTE